MNPDKEVDRNRLFRAMEWSYRQLEPWRNLVRGLVEEYAGSGYGPQSHSRHEILMNLMNQTVDAYTMSLVANRPRIMVSTKSEPLRYFAKQFEVATNNLIEEINLECTLRQAVLDAFFCLGIVKVHMGDSAEVQLEADLWMDPGTPYASNVALDNWVHDMSASQYQKIKYAGDWYRLPFEDLQDNDLFIQDVVSELAPSSKHGYDSGDERLDRISIGEDTDQDEIEPMVDLMDVWIPREGKIFTFPMEPSRPFSGKFGPVAVMDWNGPEFGPYHLLSFNDVPENIMPTSPAAHLSGLARLANSILRKQSRQAKRQREIYTYTPAGAESAKKAQRTDDGQFVEVQDPNEIGVMKTGGVDSGNQAFLLGVVEMYDRMAGNLKAMMGLGAQADTLGQEQLIHGAVSKKEAQMQYRVVSHATGIIRDLGYMLWHDAAKVLPGTIPVPGADDYSIDATWTPEDREGDFFDYNLSIDVFSMAYQSPAQKIQALNMLLTQIYAPMGQLLTAQGGQIDLRKLTDLYADLMNVSQLKEIVRFGNSPMMPPGGPGQSGGAQQSSAQSGGKPSGGKPPATTRRYIRQNIPTGGTAQSRAVAEQKAWLNRSQGMQAGNPVPAR